MITMETEKGKVHTNYNYNYKMLFKGTKIKTKIFKGLKLKKKGYSYFIKTKMLIVRLGPISD